MSTTSHGYQNALSISFWFFALGLSRPRLPRTPTASPIVFSRWQGGRGRRSSRRGRPAPPSLALGWAVQRARCTPSVCRLQPYCTPWPTWGHGPRATGHGRKVSSPAPPAKSRTCRRGGRLALSHSVSLCTARAGHCCRALRCRAESAPSTTSIHALSD